MKLDIDTVLDASKLVGTDDVFDVIRDFNSSYEDGDITSEYVVETYDGNGERIGHNEYLVGNYHGWMEDGELEVVDASEAPEGVP